LDEQLQTYLDQAEYTIPRNCKLKALIGPHAGYVYSGPNQAWAYRNIDKSQYDRIVLLGPSHKVALDFVAQTTCSQWECPLGNIQIDQEAVNELEAVTTAEFSKIQVKYEENEHSLEMHLPYIKKVF
jgi:AmmeMemoRadiSam system protein B